MSNFYFLSLQQVKNISSDIPFSRQSLDNELKYRELIIMYSNSLFV